MDLEGVGFRVTGAAIVGAHDPAISLDLELELGARHIGDLARRSAAAAAAEVHSVVVPQRHQVARLVTRLVAVVTTATLPRLLPALLSIPVLSARRARARRAALAPRIVYMGS
eukprot:scaffold57293_cov63-Phaeocystis_antarctica.AAC.2